MIDREDMFVFELDELLVVEDDFRVDCEPNRRLEWEKMIGEIHNKFLVKVKRIFGFCLVVNKFGASEH